jgi:glycosyltransferase involved in cell wall biosynthesis
MILQVLDASHSEWVQGGTFEDLRVATSCFENTPFYLSPIPKSFSVLGWVNSLISIKKEQNILFSSMSPAENFFRVRRFMNHSGALGLWFTHKDGSFSKRELSVLKKMDLIFVHSLNAIDLLKNLTSARIVHTLGALDPERFSRPAKYGKQLVWVGTPVERKRPEVLVELIRRFPEENFRILGKGWKESIYWPIIGLQPNVEYMELNGPLTSSHLDGCDIYLMTSRIEGGPMPLMECLAAGLSPVIASKTGFVEDLLKICNLPLFFSGIGSSDIHSEVLRIRGRKELPVNISRNEVLEYTFEKLARVITSSYREVQLVKRSAK